MAQRISALSLLVPDYDEAIAHYVGDLGFELISDTPLSPEKRWVLVAPAGASGPHLLLAKAKNDAERARIGDQTGGRVFLFLETDDLDRDHAAWSKAGITFIGAPRIEDYGKVVVFKDRYGNLWDLIQRHDV